MSPRRRRLAEKFRSLYLWHRYAGVVAALLAAWLAVTGILLNHADDLRLAQRHVGQKWLLSLYNIQAPHDLRGMPVAGHWLVETGGHVYLDEQVIATGDVVAAVETDFGFALAFADRLQLYTADAALVETLPFTLAASPITGLVAAPGGDLFVITDTASFRTDAAVTTFTRTDTALVPAAVEPQSLPAELEAGIAQHALTHTLSWERVLLDAHGGRILGRTGVWLADIAGGLLLLLAVSGVLVWLRRRRRSERK